MPQNQKAILITGASSGIGKAIALHYADKGFDVFATVRKLDDGAALRAGGCVPVIMDVTNEASVAAAVEVVKAARGGSGLDILVANAGISGTWAPLELSTTDQWRTVFETNVFGVATTVRLFLPLLRQAAAHSKPKATRVIITGSAAGKMAAPFMASYAASKHAVEAIADSLRGELYPQGIHVAVLEPGVIRTEIQAKHRSETLAYHDSLPADKIATYQPLMDRVRTWFAVMEKDDIPMQKLLATMDAAALGSPYARYPCDGKVAYFLWLKWGLPDWAWDWLAPQLQALMIAVHGVEKQKDK